jgi:glutathione synthase/RimK-type ligase-like ATP-grasp enzyme
VKSAVLILTEEQDLHADRVCEELLSRRIPFLRFHTSDFPYPALMTIQECAQRVEGRIVYNGQEMATTDIRSVWYRRPGKPTFPQGWAPGVREFAVRETQLALRGLYEMIPTLWVSQPGAINRAELKIGQLAWARRLGFRIPDTLITNDPAEVRDFYSRHDGQIVGKTLSAGGVDYSDGSTGIIFTTPVTEAHAVDFDRVSVTPCLFQEYISKRIELRVAVFGRRVLAAEIHSQEHELSRHDWRRYQMGISWRAHALPPDLSEKCALLVASLGLEFGCLDLIVTPDGEHVFLELNPNGQWAFLEDFAGLPVTDAMVTLLADGPGNADLTAASLRDDHFSGAALARVNVAGGRKDA